ncbi:MAG: phytanoyl-CoA dioxygenase family protein [Actinomycetota bacterium]
MSPQAFDVDDPAAARHFRDHGWVLVESLDDEQRSRLSQWADEVAAWPETDGVLHYRELTDDGPKLCRSENFVPVHEGLRALLTSGGMLQTAAALLGETAVLYKEKVNYKLAGGAGYSPHQDAPAYPFIDNHVSCMVAIDAADEHNGCLEVVSGMHHEVLPMNDVGCIRDDIVATMRWSHVPLLAGQTLWFHSRTPHRSGANRSGRDRRALYPTYNAAAEGDLRDAYYRSKLEQMARTKVGDGVQVSLIGDFQGRPVTS